MTASALTPKLCWTLVLYGHAKPISAFEVVNCVSLRCGKNDFQPKGTDIQWNTESRMKRTPLKKLLMTVLPDELKEIAILSIEGKLLPMMGRDRPEMAIYYENQRWHSKKLYYFEIFPDDKRVRNQGDVFQCIEDLPTDLRPRYGFAGWLDWNENPLSFAVGVWSGGMDEAAMRSVAARRMFAFQAASQKSLHLVDKMRDLFPFNVLSDGHLDHSFEGMTLREWIVKSSTGRLARIRNDLYLWSLSDAEIDRTRPLLLSAGALLTSV